MYKKKEIALIFKCVTWIIFQVITIGIFMKYTPLDNWLFKLDNKTKKQNKMKKSIKLLVFASILYVLFGFISVDINFINWIIQLRIVYVIIILIVLFISWLKED